MRPILLLGVTCALPALLLVDPFAAGDIRLGPPEPLLADGEPIDTGEYVGYAGPLVTDFDGDGDQDLLIGNFRGSIQHFENVGEADAARFESRGLLQAEGEDIELNNW